mmetsp:Transcript_10512/g.21294  ORF Transcript_10512/g.21294 Transcript_10512/m.21294 type:complete len:284 (+) Transcript_10512:52-903(+)
MPAVVGLQHLRLPRRRMATHILYLLGNWAALLRPPSAKDISGPGGRRRKAFDKPRQPLRWLVVLDFEWTCDRVRGFGPPEIIEFPSVLLQSVYPFEIIDEFQVYCRPRTNPILSNFCRELTGISQAQVDGGVSIQEALQRHTAWLRSHGLLPDEADGSGMADTAAPLPFAIVTWGDVDVMSTLDAQCKREDVMRPAHFDHWINLKAIFQRHYKKEPRGGLQSVVENICRLTFDGRAHSGLVDSQNTAKICLQMLRQGFVFDRTTRGFSADGVAYGQRRVRPRM